MIPPATRCGRRRRRRLRPLVARAAAPPGANHDRKHVPAAAHLWILLFHVLDGADGLRQTHGRLAAVPRVCRRLGLRRGISRSQLARSSTSREPACFARLLPDLVALARPVAARDPAWQALAKVQAVDRTFLRLAAKLSPWSRAGGHVPGVRLRVGLDLAGAIPAAPQLSRPSLHDAAAFDRRDLAPLAGWTLLVDLGYYGHARFARLREAGVSFIRPLQAQAGYQITAERPVTAPPTADGDVVLADEEITEITLGSPPNHKGAVLPRMRLVTSRNAAGVVHRFVTDRWDLTAAEVVTLHRKRWQIELFFRWLKSQLSLTRPFGASQEAVWLTVPVGAIVAVLLLPIEAERPPGQSHVEWLRGVAAAVQTATTDSG
jgi:hypothetical protein